MHEMRGDEKMTRYVLLKKLGNRNTGGYTFSEKETKQLLRQGFDIIPFTQNEIRSANRRAKKLQR